MKENKIETKIIDDSIKENIQKFGIGHIGKVEFSIENISIKERKDILETYSECIENIEILSKNISNLLDSIQIDEEKQKIFDDLKNGIDIVLNRVANQVLYHAKEESDESINAFDELNMLLKEIHESLISPEIINKKEYKDSVIYNIEPTQDKTEHRKIISVDTLFSKNHIAWNIVSQSLYDRNNPTKAGIRLDYGPLYKEENNKIDKSKTEWMTSVDISGFHIDKILNKYSLRGHHFTKLFDYKVGLIIPGLSKLLEEHFDPDLDSVHPHKKPKN